jgi:hypothetical protein
MRRKRCSDCGLLTARWQRVNGGPWHCYDGCYSTTGRDRRSPNGIPMWVTKYTMRTVTKKGTVRALGKVFSTKSTPGTTGRFGLNELDMEAILED